MKKLLLVLTLCLYLVSPSWAVNNPFASSIQGDTSAGSTDAGRPVKIGGVGRTDNTGSVSAGQRVNLREDKTGKPIVVLVNVREMEVYQATTITSSAAETTILTAVASTFLDLTHLTVTNSSTTGATCTIRDATAAGTPWVIYVPALGGIEMNFPVPLVQGTVNTNWTATCTSVASINILAQAMKNI